MPSPLNIWVDQLVAILGLPDALKLVRRFGGGSLYLPHPSRLCAGNKVVQEVGMAVALKLCCEWPQLDVMIPRLATELRRMRDRAIRREEGLSVTEIAWKYETTERHVYRVRLIQDDGDEFPPPDRSQLDLFHAD
jgi:Mor family transcriptional regulator